MIFCPNVNKEFIKSSQTSLWVLYLQKRLQFIDYIISIINGLNMVISRQVAQIISIIFISLINSKVEFFIVFNITCVQLINVFVLNKPHQIIYHNKKWLQSQMHQLSSN